MEKNNGTKVRSEPTTFEYWHNQRIIQTNVPWQPYVNPFKYSNAEYLDGKSSNNTQKNNTNENESTFSPKLNRSSLKMASTICPLSKRVPSMLKQKKDKVDRLKSYLEERDMLECSFTPNIYSQTQSEKYLKRAGISHMSSEWPQHVFDMQETYRQKLELRREQQEIESHLESPKHSRRFRHPRIRSNNMASQIVTSTQIHSPTNVLENNPVKGYVSPSHRPGSSSSSPASEDDCPPPPPPYDEAFRFIHSSQYQQHQQKALASSSDQKTTSRVNMGKVTGPPHTPKADSSTPLPVPIASVAAAVSEDVPTNTTPNHLNIRSKSAPAVRRTRQMTLTSTTVTAAPHAYTRLERERRERMRRQVLTDSTTDFTVVLCDEPWLQSLCSELKNANTIMSDLGIHSAMGI